MRRGAAASESGGAHSTLELAEACVREGLGCVREAISMPRLRELLDSRRRALFAACITVTATKPTHTSFPAAAATLAVAAARRTGPQLSRRPVRRHLTL